MQKVGPKRENYIFVITWLTNDGDITTTSHAKV